MAKVLNSKEFTDQLREMGQVDFDVSEARGYPVLQQTRRNQLKAELTLGLKEYLARVLDTEENHIANVYMVNEGIAIEVENESVGQKVEEGNGMITMIVDIKFKSLDYDAMIESDEYTETKAAKEELKKEKEAAKKAKMAADAAKRAARANKE